MLYGCTRLVATVTVDYSSQVLYEGCTPEKKFKYAKKAGVVAIVSCCMQFMHKAAL